MGKPKKITKPERDAIRAKKRREWYSKIKNDPVLYEQQKEKERLRYLKRKEDKKITSIKELAPRDIRMKRKQWRQNQNAYYRRKIEKKNTEEEVFLEDAGLNTINEEIDPLETENQPQRPQPSTSRGEILTNTPVTRSRFIHSEMRCPDSPTSSISATSATSARSKTSGSTIIRKQRYRSSKIVDHLQKTVRHLQKLNNMYRQRISRLERKNKDTSQRNTNSDTDVTDLVREIPDLAKRKLIRKELNTSKMLKRGLTQSYSGLNNKRKQNMRNDLGTMCASLKTSNLLHTVGYIGRKSRVKPDKKANDLKQSVKSFYLEEENSQVRPGKFDYITRKGIREQKRFLNDTLINLHKKFNSSSDSPVSYPFFCRQRPFWVIAPKNNIRDTCACKQHQNVDLLVKALKKKDIITEKNHTELLQRTCCNPENLSCLKGECQSCKNKVLAYKEFDNSENMEYWQWQNNTKQITIKGTEKTVRVVEKRKIVDLPRNVIIILQEALQSFCEHVSKIKNQFMFLKELKNNLHISEIILHIDFSENYLTKYGTEIQSFHFGGSRQQISIHTVVLYYRDESTDIVKTKSICTISECLRHDAAAVWSHLIPVLNYVKDNLPEVNTIHVTSDSPSSQYRNKTIFYIISKLKWDLPQLTSVTWNFQEVGHGKGAPDGLGATLKRSADRAVLHGSDVASFDDFFEVVTNAAPNIQIEKVSESDILQKELLVPKDLKSFKGTMKVHQAVWNSTSNEIALRTVSCSSQLCKYKASKCQHGKHIGFYKIHDEVINIAESEDTEHHNKENEEIQRGVAANIILNPRVLHQSREFARQISEVDNLSLPSGMLMDFEDLIEPLSVTELCKAISDEEIVNPDVSFESTMASTSKNKDIDDLLYYSRYSFLKCLS